MRKKVLIECKDYKNRFNFYKIEDKLIVLKSIINDRTLDSRLRIKARFELFKILYKVKFPRTKIRNRCLITGRTRFLISVFRVSRIEFRRLVKFNSIPGVKRSSW